VAECARIVLIAAEGLTGPQIAERAGCTEPTMIKWRQYAEAALGLDDAPRLAGPEQGRLSANAYSAPIRRSAQSIKFSWSLWVTGADVILSCHWL